MSPWVSWLTAVILALAVVAAARALRRGRRRSTSKDSLEALAGELWVPARTTSGDRLELGQIEHRGQRVTPAFTREEHLLRALPDGEPFVTIHGRALLSLLAPGTTLVLDPGTDHSRTLSPEELVELAVDGEGDDSFSLRDGRDDHRPLSAALATLLPAFPEVARAHLAEVHRPGRAPSLAVGLAADGDFDALVRRLVLAAQDPLRRTGTVDFVPLGGEGQAAADRAPSPLARELAHRIPPFYRRSPAGSRPENGELPP